MLMLPGCNMINMYIYMALFFIFGLICSARSTIGFCLVLEYSPSQYHTLLGTIWSALEATI